MRELASDREIGEALGWISRVLTDHDVPYQVVGGLAVHAYGGTRPVVDIDLYAPLSNADALVETLAPATIWGPQAYRDDSWDLRFMKLDHGRVRIEIGDSTADPKYYDRVRQRWAAQRIDFGGSHWHTVFGVPVPVMPRTELLVYKEALGRDVDEIDLAQLAASGSTTEP